MTLILQKAELTTWCEPTGQHWCNKYPPPTQKKPPTMFVSVWIELPYKAGIVVGVSLSVCLSGRRDWTRMKGSRGCSMADPARGTGCLYASRQILLLCGLNAKRISAPVSDTRDKSVLLILSLIPFEILKTLRFTLQPTGPKE